MKTKQDLKPLKKYEEDTEPDQSAESHLMSTIIGENSECPSFPFNLVPHREYRNSDVQRAMQEEIKKYKSFKAFEEVTDEGQDSLPVRSDESKKTRSRYYSLQKPTATPYGRVSTIPDNAKKKS